MKMFNFTDNQEYATQIHHDKDSLSKNAFLKMTKHNKYWWGYRVKERLGHCDNVH
jgi:hypothetical protein